MFTEVITVTTGPLNGYRYAIADDTNFKRDGGTIVLDFEYRWWARKPRITATQTNDGREAISRVLPVDASLKIKIVNDTRW
jgi:hypothetical protein